MRFDSVDVNSSPAKKRSRAQETGSPQGDQENRPQLKRRRSGRQAAKLDKLQADAEQTWKLKQEQSSSDSEDEDDDEEESSGESQHEDDSDFDESDSESKSGSESGSESEDSESSESESEYEFDEEVEISADTRLSEDYIACQLEGITLDALKLIGAQTGIYTLGHARGFDKNRLGYTPGVNSDDLAYLKKTARAILKDEDPESRYEKKVQKPKKPNPGQVLRTKMNKAIDHERHQKAKLRDAWIADNFDAIEPFVTDKIKAKYRNAAHRDLKALKVAPLKKQPKSIEHGQMRGYQLKGLNFMRNLYKTGVSCIMGDEMGLGKTLQSISVLANLLDSGVRGPHLVIVPLSVLKNWQAELRRWCPKLRVVEFYGAAKKKRALQNQLNNAPDSFDVIVTTFETAVSDGRWIGRLHYRVMIIDEAHKLKNSETNWYKAIKRIKRVQCLMLTGTPLQNNLHELWALLSFMDPDLFPESGPFDDAFDLTKQVVDRSKLALGRKLLEVLMIRRVKTDVEQSIPPKTEVRVNVGLSPYQRFWYKRILGREAKFLDQLSGVDDSFDPDKSANSNAYKRLLSIMSNLRKICNHPYIISSAMPDPYSVDEHVVEASQKLRVVDKLTTKLLEEGHRILIFSQFTKTLDILEDWLELRAIPYLRLDGSTNAIRRQVDISRFNSPHSKYQVYLITTRAGGLGINLFTADTVIHYDSDWNPQCDLQAQARSHRIGQTKPVKVYRMVTEGTVEERIVNRSQKKLFLDAMVCGQEGSQGSDFTDDDLKLDTKEVMRMMRFGAQAVFNAADADGAEINLDALLQRADQEAISTDTKGRTEISEASRARLTKTDTHVGNFQVSFADLTCREFEGQQFKRSDSMRDIADQWLDLGKRKQKSRGVMIGGDLVLHENNYDMHDDKDMGLQSTGLSCVASANNVKQNRSKKEIVHMDFCQNCGLGGELVLCSMCPSAYHLKCVGLKEVPTTQWRCPSHRCATCQKSAGDCGFIFRCVCCPHSFCEEHVPRPEFEFVGHKGPKPESRWDIDDSPMLEAHGYTCPKSQIYIVCSNVCKFNYEDQADFYQSYEPPTPEWSESDRIWHRLPKRFRSHLTKLVPGSPMSPSKSSSSSSSSSNRGALVRINAEAFRRIPASSNLCCHLSLLLTGKQADARTNETRQIITDWQGDFERFGGTKPNHLRSPSKNSPRKSPRKSPKKSRSSNKALSSRASIEDAIAARWLFLKADFEAWRAPSLHLLGQLIGMQVLMPARALPTGGFTARKKRATALSDPAPVVAEQMASFFMRPTKHALVIDYQRFRDHRDKVKA